MSYSDFSRSTYKLGKWFVFKLGFHLPVPFSLPAPLNPERKKQSSSVLSVRSGTQKHPGKDQDCRPDLQAGGCPFPFPTAAMPPQRQFLFLAPCRFTTSRH